MKRCFYLLIFLLIVMISMIPCKVKVCFARMSPGDAAPVFSLEDLNGKRYDLEKMRDTAMITLYFFDVESIPSQEGLSILDSLLKKYEGMDINVLAITVSAKEHVYDFVSKGGGINFPLLLDVGGVARLYQNTPLLPTICILGPNLKVMDYFQGGGKRTTEAMLIRVAERQLQRRNIKAAKVIADEVKKRNPENVKAELVGGYTLFEDGDVSGAERVFIDVSQKGKEGAVLGREGLAVIYAHKGQPEKALELANEVESMAPERGLPYSIRGDILYSQGRKGEAEAAYKEALAKREIEVFQEPVINNKMGRMQADTGNYEIARGYYNQALLRDPYYTEAITNKGLTFEREGRLAEALGIYQDAVSLDREDAFASVLMKRVQELIDLNKDAERKKRMDALVNNLAERFRKQKFAAEKREDTWTSRPMILSLVDFQESGALNTRDGFSMIFTTQLADYLNASGRVRVVERILIERLLEELNLGSSDLADRETALRLGKVLAAKLLGTGSFFHFSSGTLLNLRLIDTETTNIARVITTQMDPHSSFRQELYKLNKELLKTVATKYPIQGYIVDVTNKQVTLNVGLNQGVTIGTRFEVLEDQKPIEFKGKVIHPAPKQIGKIEIIQVEPELAFARILDQTRALKQEDKIRELAAETAMEDVNVL